MRTPWEKIDALSAQLTKLQYLRETSARNSEVVISACNDLEAEIRRCALEAEGLSVIIPNDNNVPPVERTYLFGEIQNATGKIKKEAASEIQNDNNAPPVEESIEPIEFNKLLGLPQPFVARILPLLRNDPLNILNLRATCRFFRKIIPDQERIAALQKILDLKLFMPILERYQMNGIPLECDDETQKNEMVFKCVFVGDTMTGKTSFIRRYEDPNRVLPKIEKGTTGVDFCLKKIIHKSFTLAVQMWDIAGQERFGTLTRVYYRDTKLFFIMFDVTKRSTFDSITKWVQTIVNNNTEADVTKILLANRCGTPEKDWACTKEEIDFMCEAYNIKLWFLVDSHQNINIEKSMEESLALHFRNMLISEGKIKIPELKKISEKKQQQAARRCTIQ